VRLKHLLFLVLTLAVVDCSLSNRPESKGSTNLVEQTNVASTSQPINTVEFETGPDITESQAIEIASNAVLTAYSEWKQVTVHRAQSNAEGWSVMIWKNPARVGGFCTVQLNTTGGVIRIVGGL